MSRLLLLIVIAALIYLVIKSYRKETPRGGGTAIAEDMVCCAHCGVHLPRSESIEADGRYFCSVEHRDVQRR